MDGSRARRSAVDQSRDAPLTRSVDVLVIDGIAKSRTKLSDRLRSVGYMVEATDKCDEAAIVMKLCRVRVVVLDSELQGIDGLSALTNVPDPPPVVLLSALPSHMGGKRRIAHVLHHASNPLFPDALIEEVCLAVRAVETVEDELR